MKKEEKCYTAQNKGELKITQMCTVHDETSISSYKNK